MPRDDSSPREQFRLLVLVSMLMLVVLLMTEAAKPSTWYWLWGGPGALDTGEAGGVPAADTRLPDVPRPGRPVDAFVAVPHESDDSSGDPDASELPLGVQRRWLATLEDNTVLRAAESEAWFGMLAILAKTDPQTLEDASLGPVAFASLLRQTSEYRGRLVTVSGTVRRVVRVDAVENGLGITRYWQCWLQPGGGSSPIVVYALHLPERFPTGTDLRAPASFTGFCYKRWAYLAADGTRVAPLLLARTARWQPPLPPRADWQPPPAAIVVAVSGLALLATMLAVLVYRTTRFSTRVLATTGERVSGDTWRALAAADSKPASGWRSSESSSPPASRNSAAGVERSVPPEQSGPVGNLGSGGAARGGEQNEGG
jgi:hypothetical protein